MNLFSYLRFQIKETSFTRKVFSDVAAEPYRLKKILRNYKFMQFLYDEKKPSSMGLVCVLR